MDYLLLDFRQHVCIKCHQNNILFLKFIIIAGHLLECK